MNVNSKVGDLNHRYATPNEHYDSKQDFLNDLVRIKDYPCVAEAYDAYRHEHDSSVVLFILAAIESRDLFIFDFSRSDKYEVKLTQNDLADLVYFKENFTNNLNLQKPNLEEAEDIGKKLYRILIPDELDKEIQEKYDKVEWSAWIYCKNEEFNPIWEWLYITSKTSNNTETSDVASDKTPDKNSSSPKKKFGLLKWHRNPKNKLSSYSPVEKPQENKKEEGFFWGDEFSIIRLSKNCNFEIERSESQINSVAILFDKDCKSARSDEKCLFDLCRRYSIDPSHYNFTSDSPNALPIVPFDYMHIAADIDIIKKNYDKFMQALTMAATSLSRNLNIFYNIWNAKKRNAEKQRSMHNIQLKVVDSIPAKTRIYTSFDVQKDFAALFAKCFYDCAVEENDVAKAIKKAREEIKDGYLFSTTNRELERALNDHNIRKLKEIFKSEHHITLSDPVIVKNIAEEHDIGRISDNEKTYNVKKKDGKLTIYETGRNLSFNRFCRFAYVVYGNPFTAAIWARS